MPLRSRLGPTDSVRSTALAVDNPATAARTKAVAAWDMQTTAEVATGAAVVYT
ncbi:hypothetical protein [Streptomyces sp. NPDC048643]|uniref:hypothetical protein n=1 Tax=Streptomyces sp. NPDC048643 TaxID=3155637 RepID=UPI003430D479